MTIAEWVGIISVVLVLIGLIGTTNFRINKEIQESELRSKEAIESVIEGIGAQKELDDNKFVEVKVCKIVHANTDKELQSLNKKMDDISGDVKKLLAKAGIS